MMQKYQTEDTSLGKKQNKTKQQASGVACLGGRLGSNEGQRQSTSLIPAMLAQRKELCEICLGGDSFGKKKEHLLM